jgi:release factor glutamine methyltransferase
VTATVAAALAEARARGVDRLDAQLMLAAILGVARSALIAHDDLPVPLDAQARWAQWLARRAAGEPLAYLLGTKEFHGLAIEVNADVLVPRPETELLVDWALALVAALATLGRGASDGGAASVLDLGTGSGAIALALKQRQPSLVVSASDVSAAALAVAGRNASRLGLAIELVESSWWQALAGRCFELVVANPPYIAADAPQLAALRHEPRTALTPGGDGLDAIRAIVAGAPAHLRPGGWLLVEHGFDQGRAVRALFAAAGLASVETRADLAGHERATGGRRLSPPSG